MEAPRTTLDVHLPWPQTAALLGLALAHDALPARTSCPAFTAIAGSGATPSGPET